MPQEQYEHFNHLIHVMNAVNGELSLFAGIVREFSVQLQLRAAWLTTLALWSSYASDARQYFDWCAPEPITESAYREKLARTEAELVPIEELAEVMVDQFDGWGPQDLDDDGTVSDSAWDRLYREKRRELAELVASGTIEGRQRKRKVWARFGSFYQHLGKTVPLGGDYGSEFTVFPDDEAGAVPEKLAFRQHMRERLMGGSRFLHLVEGSEPDLEALGDPEPGFTALAYTLAEALRRGIPGAGPRLGP